MVSVFIYAVFFLGIAAFGLAFIYMDNIVLEIFGTVDSIWPQYFTGAEWTFELALWNWSPLILALIPLLIWVFQNTQRKAEGARI